MSRVATEAQPEEHGLKGTIAAAFTPLRSDGDEVDVDAIGSYMTSFREGGPTL